MKDLPSNEHLPLIDVVIALVLVAGVTKTGQYLSAFRFRRDRTRPAFQYPGIPRILFS